MAMIEFEARDQRSKEAFLAALRGYLPARAPYDWIAVAISPYFSGSPTFPCWSRSFAAEGPRGTPAIAGDAERNTINSLPALR